MTTTDLMTPNNFYYAANDETNFQIRLDLDARILELNRDGFLERIYEGHIDIEKVYLAMRENCYTETLCQDGIKITRELPRRNNQC